MTIIINVMGKIRNRTNLRNVQAKREQQHLMSSPQHQVFFFCKIDFTLFVYNLPNFLNIFNI
jgi:RNA recognition motif-containing protein